MNRITLLASLLFVVAPGVTHASMDRHYALQKTSLYEDGCFAPCLCPVLIHDDLRGRFSLTPVGSENGYDVFDVRNAQWFVTLSDGSTILIQGSGRYRSSAIYKLQRLEMDLLVADRPLEHYDSGLVPIRVPSPYINITISMNGQYCHDTVFTVAAAPSPTAVRPPKLQFGDKDVDKDARTTWGRLKKLWTP